MDGDKIQDYEEIMFEYTIDYEDLLDDKLNTNVVLIYNLDG